MRRILFTLVFTCLASPVAAADFSYFYLINPNFVSLGDPIEYHIVFVMGSDQADEAKIEDPLPTGLEFVPGSLVCYMPPSSGACSYDPPTRTVNWAASGALQAHDAVDIYFSVTTTGLSGPGYVTNVATASANGYNTRQEAHTTVAHTGDDWPVLGEIMTLAASDPDNMMAYATGVSWNPVSERYYAGWIRADNNTGQWYVDARTIAPSGVQGISHQLNVVATPGEMPGGVKVGCSTASTGCLAAWEETQPGDWRPSVRGRLLDGDGVPVGTELVIAEDSTIGRREIDVVYNSTLNEYLVAYVNELDSGLIEVGATRVRESDGAVLGSAIVASGSDGERTGVRAAHLPGQDRYMIVFDHEDSLDEQEIHAKFANGNLAGVGAAPEIVVAGGGGQDSGPAVGAHGDDFLVAWRHEDDWPPTFSEVRARRFAGDGTPLGPAGGFLVDEFEGVAGIRVREVEYAGDQGFLIGWYYSDDRSPTGKDHHGRFVESGADQAAYTEFPTLATSEWDREGFLTCAAFGRCMILAETFDGVTVRFVSAWRTLTDGFEDGTFDGWSAVVGAAP